MPDSQFNLTAAWERAAISSKGGAATLMVKLAAPQPANNGKTRRAPIDVAFVLDRSGSMAGRKIDIVKKAVDLAAGLLDENDRAALVIYDNEVNILRPLEFATSRIKSGIRLALHEVEARGSTNLCGGWLTGCQELAGGQEMQPPGETRIRRSLLLTDGLANVGETSPVALGHHASELRQRGISTTTLGVGDGFDESLLSSLAEAGGGNFQFISDAGQLAEFFSRELGELMTITASAVNVRLTLPKGVRAELVNPYPVNRTGKRLDVALGDLPAGDEVILIFTVTAKASALGTAFAPSLSVRWTEPSRSSRQTEEVTLSQLISTDEHALGSIPLDQEVSEQSALQRAAAEQREAMRLDQAGQFRESRARHALAHDMLVAAPPSPLVQERTREAKLYASYDPTIAFASETRKQNVYDSMRRTRGKRDDS